VLRSYGLSDTGRVRRTNEDCYAIDGDRGLFVVADGMGGHAAGEVASRLAVEAIVGFVRRTDDTEEFSWPYGIDTTLSYQGNRLRTAIHLANRRVFRAAESHDDYTGMGTTVVSALLSAGLLVVGHVGDSRLYLLREDRFEQLTCDDTWLATVLPGQPGWDPSAAAEHPMRHVLTNVLGAREDTEVHLREVPLEGGERFLLCTDGLHGVVGSDTIRTILAEDTDLERTAGRLVAEAVARGSQDNITVVLVAEEGDHP
jgi:serine/threonine protein phosphatase PrpC